MLFGWSKCPIAEDDRLWIERRLTWLCQQFGGERLQFGTIVLPTADFFPETYHPTEEGVGILLRRVCDYMGVDPARVNLAFFSARKPVVFNAELIDPQGSAAGLYDEQAGLITIWLDVGGLSDPHSVVATLAHELAHVHLLGDGRVTREEPDHEPLADLLTTFLGLGLFTANDVLRDGNWRSGLWEGWRVQAAGYLTAPLHGYALALCAWCRKDEPCAWRRYLRADVRSVFDKSLSYLKSIGAPRFPDCAAGPATPPGAFQPRQPDPGEASDDGDVPRSNDEDDTDLAETDLAEIDVAEDEQEPAAAHPATDNALADLYFERALLDYQSEAFTEAIIKVTKAIDQSPDDSEFYALRAKAYVQLEQYREALKDAEKAVRLDPDDDEARRARGFALLNTGKPNRARDDFDYLIRENRHDAEAYYLRGLSHAALGNHDRAVADYTKAITKNPNLVETYFARHQAYKELGISAKAEADLQEGLWRRAQLNRGA